MNSPNGPAIRVFFIGFTPGHSTASCEVDGTSTLLYKVVVSILRSPDQIGEVLYRRTVSMSRVANAWRIG